MVNKGAAMAMTGIAATTLATAAYMMSHPRPHSRRLKRNAAKAIRTLGSVLDSLESIMR